MCTTVFQILQREICLADFFVIGYQNLNSFGIQRVVKRSLDILISDQLGKVHIGHWEAVAPSWDWRLGKCSCQCVGNSLQRLSPCVAFG